MLWIATLTVVLIIDPVWSEPVLIESTPQDLKIRLYAADGSYSWWPLEGAADLFTTSGYNSTLALVMVILGHDESQDLMIRQTVQALLKRKLDEQYNILAVELPDQFSINVRNLYYLKPAMNAPSAGAALGEFINKAVAAGSVSPDKVNVISFSLGVQIAGYMGRKVNGLIHSITGVDPSGVGFDWSRLMTGLVHVSHKDARFVHLYHSDSAMFGTTLRLGTADYMFNDGESQPGCNNFDLMCSHLRGFSYFLEALSAVPGLPAVQCNNNYHLEHCKCQGNRISYVGFPPDISVKGIFVLRTGEGSPFSLGKDGITGTKCMREKTDFILKMGMRYDKLMHML